MELSELPNDIDELKNIILRREKELNHNKQELKEYKFDLIKKDHQIESLNELLNVLRRTHYVPSSEVVSSSQLGFFNEVESFVEDEKEEERKSSKEITIPEHKRTIKRKLRIPDLLPRKEVLIDLPEEEKICSIHGTPLKKIGETSSEKLEFIPAKIQVIKTIRPEYANPCCEDSTIKSAPLPPTILPKTMAGPSVLATLIISKYQDHLPLYRLETIFKRLKIELPRQTMARWLIKVSEKLIPLYNLLQDRLLSSNYIQMDETTCQVLKEDGKKATSKSYMWVRHKPGRSPIIIFDYRPTREGKVPIELLDGFSGYLQIDGYQGYSKAIETFELKRVGCMDHSRRKFKSAFNTSKGKSIGKKALIYFKKLYKIEEKINDECVDDKKRIRQEKSLPILKEMKEWLDEIRYKVAPKSEAGKAVIYTLNQWPYLIRYCEDGHLNISNAWVENAIRPFAIGRKNHLFSASRDGAHASAMFYSLIETAKANDLEPLAYFNNLLEKIPTAETLEDYEALLPLKPQVQS